MWKRAGSDKPQQSAAAMCDSSLDERPKRQTAVDRSSCSRLQAGGRPFEPGTPILRSPLPKRNLCHRAGGRTPLQCCCGSVVEARRGRDGRAARSPSTSVASLRVPRPQAQRVGDPALSRADAAASRDDAMRHTTPGIGGLPSERALSLAVREWRPDERCPRRTSEAGFVCGPATVGALHRGRRRAVLGDGRCLGGCAVRARWWYRPV